MTLTIGFFGGAVAWSLQLVLSYVLVAVACGAEMPAPSGAATAWLTVISVLAALGAIASAFCAYVAWRRERSSRGRGGLAMVGMVLDLTFLVVIVIGASAPFVLPTCA